MPREFEDAIDAISEGRAVDWDRVDDSHALSSQEVWALKALETIRARRDDPPAELPAALRERLEFRELLGEGAFARVYRAEDRMLGRDVALKVFSAGAMAATRARERFLREARTLASLKHPNIVQIHWIEEVEGRIYLILEMIRGRTLAEIVAAEGPLVPEEAARIGADLCRALAAIHAKGLVHMDVKPANVVREEGGRVVLLDFGFARASAVQEGVANAPVGGTPLFMSPELLEGRDQIPPASDVYSVGVLLFWMVSGRYPHEARTFPELRDKILRGEPRPLIDARPDAPPRFASIVAQALAREQAERFPSAGALEEALRGLLAASHAPAPRRRLALIAGAVAVALAGVLAIATLAAGMLWQTPRDAVAAADPVAPIDFDCRLYALRDEGPVLLEENAEVRLLDRLYLEVEADRTFYLYVFNEDEHGRMHTLHPVAELAYRNPLPGPAVHRLPDEEEWQIDTEGGGSEYFYLAASAQPLEVMEVLSEVIPSVARAPAGGVTYQDLPRGTKAVVMRGIGRLTGKPVEEEETLPPGRLDEAFERLERDLAPGQGTVVRRLRLRH